MAHQGAKRSASSIVWGEATPNVVPTGPAHMGHKRTQSSIVFGEGNPVKAPSSPSRRTKSHIVFGGPEDVKPVASQPSRYSELITHSSVMLAGPDAISHDTLVHNALDMQRRAHPRRAAQVRLARCASSRRCAAARRRPRPHDRAGCLPRAGEGGHWGARG